MTDIEVIRKLITEADIVYRLIQVIDSMERTFTLNGSEDGVLTKLAEEANNKQERLYNVLESIDNLRSEAATRVLYDTFNLKIGDKFTTSGYGKVEYTIKIGSVDAYFSVYDSEDIMTIRLNGTQYRKDGREGKRNSYAFIKIPLPSI